MPRAMNSTGMRSRNEKMILSLIHRAPISRAAIAKETGLTKAAVTIIVEDLIGRGWIMEKEAEQTKGVGRTPVMLFLKKDAAYLLGVNITRREITVGVTNLAGEVLQERTLPLLPPAEAFPKIGAALEQVVTEAAIPREKIYKLGLVTPGPVDLQKGAILNPPNFDGWQNIPVVDEMKAYTDVDITLENVSNGTALAEKYFGAGGEVASFMALQIDEGIGSGILLKNSLFGGLCEVGHISIDCKGIPCACGNRGCLEKYASVPAILQGSSYATWQEMVDAGDTQRVKTEAFYLQTAITTVNNLFDLDAVVLCGEISYRPEALIASLREQLQGKMLSGRPLKIFAGQVRSKTLVAAAVALGRFFGISGVKNFPAEK